jgi:hypothetical protein
LTNIKKISAGRSFSLFLAEDNFVLSCGRSLVNSFKSDKYTPEQVDFKNNKIVYINCGYEHAAAVDENGVLYTWGSNTCYQLGTNDNVTIFNWFNYLIYLI